MSGRLRPGLLHLAGCIGALVVALVLLNTLFPYAVGLVFPKAGPPAGLRCDAIDYLFVALVPVVVWLVPPLVRALARATHRAHRSLFGLWAARMFPPVLAAVSIYRIVIEPDVLPGPWAWADREGITLSPGVESELKGLRPKGGPSSESAKIPSTSGSAQPSAGLRPAAYTSESVRDEGREERDKKEGRHDD